VDIFDRRKKLLNVENGTLDLEAEDNGKENFDGIVLKKHDRKDLITKKAEVIYDPNAPKEDFERFMRTILPNDEVRLFVQRYLGYCLTGSIEEQAILCLWGEGSNGKSTLIDLMHEVFGDYAMVTPVEVLLH